MNSNIPEDEPMIINFDELGDIFNFNQLGLVISSDEKDKEIENTQQSARLNIDESERKHIDSIVFQAELDEILLKELNENINIDELQIFNSNTVIKNKINDVIPNVNENKLNCSNRTCK